MRVVHTKTSCVELSNHSTSTTPIVESEFGILLSLQQVKTEMDWSKARDELGHSLQEWGVYQTSKTHMMFRKRVFEESLRMMQDFGVTVSYDDLRSQKFPTEPEKAGEIVLRSDIFDENDKPRYFSIDKLDLETTFPPYFRWYKKGQRNVVQDYRLRDGIKKECKKRGIYEDELDPFRRFEFVKAPESEFWYNRWFLSDEDSDLGVILEARIACYALQFQSCYNCNFSKSLRWYGGNKASWQDLVCTVCNSMYEIKTKATMEKVQACLETNSIFGGSFERYCRLRKSIRSPDQRMYVVLLPRKPTVNRKMEKCRPVFIAEIENVLPRIGRTYISTVRHQWIFVRKFLAK